MNTDLVSIEAPAVLVPVDQELLGRVRKVIDGLPQREAIRDDDYRIWTHEVTRKFGEQALWHATRSGGFGGSQIGALVRNFSGYRADFGGSARDIVKLCLLRTMPEDPSPAMLRGVENEEAHAQRFYKKWNVQRDLTAYERLRTGQGRFQWMRYSPDDVVQYVPTGVRWLLDYKAPTEVDQAKEVAFQYAAQLHLGRLVCQESGVRIDGMLLSQFDWANWDLKDDVIEHAPAMDELIISAGNHYWNDFVLRGQLPDYVRKQTLDNKDELVEKLGELSTVYARIATLTGALDKLKSKLAKDLKSELEALRFGDNKLPFEFANVTALSKFDTQALAKALPEETFQSLFVPGERIYDHDALLKWMREQGHDLKPFVRRSADLNVEAAYTALIDAGVDPDSFLREELRISVSRDLAKQAEKWVDAQIIAPNEEFSKYVHAKPALAEPAQEIDRSGQVAEPGTQRSFTGPGSV